MAEYRVKVLIAHPDKQNGQNEDFQQLQYAKEILTDPTKRKHYDAYLSIGSALPLNEWMSNQERLKQVRILKCLYSLLSFSKINCIHFYVIAFEKLIDNCKLPDKGACKRKCLVYSCLSWLTINK